LIPVRIQLHTSCDINETHHIYLVFITDPPTTQIYTLSLHDALPISYGTFQHLSAMDVLEPARVSIPPAEFPRESAQRRMPFAPRSEEHTSELQSLAYLVCRLLLEKKKNTITCIPSHGNCQNRLADNH